MAKEKKQDGLRGISIVGRLAVLMIAMSLLALSVYAFLFLFLAMLPAIAGTFIDKRMHRHASGTISALNFTGTLPFLFDLWKSSDLSTAAMHNITDIYVWFFVYSAAAFGWLMVWAVPQISVSIVTGRAQNKIDSLRKVQKELVEEWGPEVTRG